MPNNEQETTTYPIYNQYIYKEGIGWVLIGGGGGGDSLPDQTNNSGKYLTTDGTSVSWGAVTPASIGALPTGTTAAQIGAIPDTHVVNGITQADIDDWNTDEVFIAEYGTTNKTDTLAAYNAGKAVFVKKESSGLYYFYPLTFYNSTTGNLFFRGVNPGGVDTIQLGPGNTSWSTESNSLVPTSRTVNNKALSSNITLTATDVGAIPDSAAAAGITSEDITNWNNKPSVDNDEKLSASVFPTQSVSGGYRVLLTANNNSTATTKHFTDAMDYNSREDEHTARLTIGSSSRTGQIALKNTSSKYAILKAPTTTTNSGYYVNLPNAGGTLALTSDIPSSLNDLTNDPGFITTPNIPYLTCETAADTAAKTTTLVNGSFGSTDLVAGAQVLVKFTNANGVANPTISINGTTAKSIKRYGTTAPGTSATSSWNAGAIVMLIYDGTYWQMEAFMNTTYSGMSDAEVTAGTGTSNRLITPARLKTAIQTWAMPYNHDAAGITSTDITNWDAKVSDDHKWNDVALMHNLYANSTSYILPFLSSQNATQADLVTATATPTAKTVAVYDANAYLNSATPPVHDTSTKVATTDFVATELSYIDGLPTQTNNAGKFLTTNGTTASWTSIDTLLDYKGVKSTAAQLPSSNNVTGDVWLVSEDNSEYIWNGTTWEKFGPTIDLSGYVPTSRKVNNKALSSDITLTASDVGAIPDSAPAAGITNTDITAWNNKPSVDELVKVENAHGVNHVLPLLLAKDYYSAGNWTTTAYSSNRIAFTDYGTPTLYIKNTNNDKYATYQYDNITLANSNHAYNSYIYTSNNLTANASYTLPSTSGTLALVSQIPTSLNDLTNDPGFVTDGDLSTTLANYMVKGVDYVTAGKKNNTTLGTGATAEGYETTASGNYAHAEGYSVKATGTYSHAENQLTTASGAMSHAEGNETTASGSSSHAEGQKTIANHLSQHVFGEYNIADSSNASSYHRGNYVEIVGNGDSTTRSNARTLDWSGNETLAGKLTLGVGPTNNMDAATKEYVDTKATITIVDWTAA